MSSSGNSRPVRPLEPPPNARKRRSKIVTFLFSCCLFEAVFSLCLLAALVLLGRHYLYNNVQTHENNIKDRIGSGNETTRRTATIIQRLSRDVLPVSYDIVLKPNLDHGNFTGRVNVTINVNKTSGAIVLNSFNLTVYRVDLIRANSSEAIPIADSEAKTEREVLEITTREQIIPGIYHLVIEYGGSTRGRITGLYESSYTSKTRGQRKMATSKFEPTYARQAYPCFDEPNMKAKFTVHLLKPDDDSYIALSNMPQVGEPTPEEGGLMVHFQESVEMSTYLSCFIVSDFIPKEVPISDDLLLRVYATPEQTEKTLYARDTAKSVIEFFIEYFAIPFPLPKLDLAAIPDFVSGAMEHWGLVTFRETALLYSEEISSSANKQRVATVVAHELAHSWFGNLVTMDWWNDLWLNEGFASYIEYKGVQHAEPTWQMMDQFLTEQLHPVLSLDATLGSHPIVQTVLTPDEITAIFDTISYNKGASVLRMLEDALGEDVFKDGVTKYLNDHKFGNAVTQDLWDALQETTDKDLDITEFMNTWTVQMGYPIIDITTNGNSYVLKQKRYLTNPEAVDDTVTPYNYRWTIPVTYITDTDSTPRYIWFNHTNEEVVVEKPTSGWIKFNYKQVGYYRVNYELEDWQKIIDNINSLTIADRSHLIEETFSLAESGHISYNIPLDLTKYLSTENEYIPWSVVSSALSQLNVYLSNSPVYALYKDYVKDIVGNAYNELTWTEDTDDEHLLRRLRATILNLACAMGHEDCLEKAKQSLQAFLTNNEVLSQDLRAIAYNYGMAESPSSYWHQLYAKFVAEKDAAEKLRLMQGLTYTKDTTLLSNLIEIAKTEEVVRGQDYFTLMQYISANPIGTPIVWDYVRENWEYLVDRFGLNERYLGRMIPSITRRFTTQTKLEEMRSFFAKYPEAGAGASARVQALETVENNIVWLSKNRETVESWITNYQTK